MRELLNKIERLADRRTEAAVALQKATVVAADAELALKNAEYEWKEALKEARRLEEGGGAKQ